MDSYDIEKRREKVFEMRTNGMTLVEIASELGITKQRVSQLYTKHLAALAGVKTLTKKQRAIINRIVFPSIKKMLLESNTSLFDWIQEHEFHNVNEIEKILWGEAKYVNLDSIKELLKATGLTFEELFEGVYEE